MRPTIVALLCLSLAGAALAAPALQSLAFRDVATITGPRVTLGELAAIQPPEAAAALASLDLGPAPLPGGSRALTVGYVKQRLRHEGLNLATVTFSGPAQVTLSRPLPDPLAAADPTLGGLATPLAAHRPATADLRSGALVVLRVRNVGLLIETPGEALCACSIGHIGRFRVIQTRALVLARLLDLSSAEVVR